jgi:hypothetical protein
VFMPLALCSSRVPFLFPTFADSVMFLNISQSERLKQVMEYLNTLHSLCKVLGIDFKQTVSDVHPSLDEDDVPRNISNATIERLELAVQRLRETKIERMQKVSILQIKSRNFIIGLVSGTNSVSSGSFKISPLQC